MGSPPPPGGGRSARDTAGWRPVPAVPVRSRARVDPNGAGPRTYVGGDRGFPRTKPPGGVAALSPRREDRSRDRPAMGRGDETVPDRSAAAIPLTLWPGRRGA